MALFLGLVVIWLNFVFLSGSGASSNGILGGPNAENGVQMTAERVYSSLASIGVLRSSPLVMDKPGSELFPREMARPTSHLAMLDRGILAPYAEPSMFGGGSVISYAVEKGDTLSKIARNFGVSVQTLIQSNPEAKTKALQIGQELVVLPVSGTLYTVKDGETAGSIADAYEVEVSDLAEWNQGVDLESIRPGGTLVIPGASIHEQHEPGVSTDNLSLKDSKEYFMRPAQGFNWGRLHHYSAVDIANACGTPITAAADGLVVDASTDEWSEGYGHYVTIEHPNGTKTKYSHLNKITAAIGDYLKQGTEVGTMGATGEATGCHLHFEVYGAANPFVR
jgi:murein DD-endopeptidase MepM/ murein hydrolase activator NlpD